MGMSRTPVCLPCERAGSFSYGMKVPKNIQCKDSQECIAAFSLTLEITYLCKAVSA